ncbi:MAG: hypothetical protein U9P90_02665 [Patescibacteria group bacterium]|nr:hypothetical protein [Patescibacteria group bacterium]
MPSPYRSTDEILWSASKMVAFLKNEIRIPRHRIDSSLKKIYTEDVISKALEKYFPLPAIDKMFWIGNSSRGIYTELADCVLGEAIKNARLYVMNENVREEFFPIKDSSKDSDPLGRISLRLFRLRFNYTVTGEEAIQLMKKAGFRPATLIESISLIITQYESRRILLSHKLVALNSKYGNTAPYIQKSNFNDGFAGYLDLVNTSFEFYHNVWRFLAVKL